MPARSKIAQLPPEMREWLHKAIVKRGFGDIVALTEELNAVCKEGGVAITIGKSAVGAESQKIKRAQETIRATTEAAKLIAESSRDDEDSRGEATMALISSDMFEALLLARESEALEDPYERLAAMSGAATAAARLSRARVNQAQWRNVIEAKVKAAADKIAGMARKGGMDAKTVAEIRASILGIAKREPPAAAPSA